ncbi:MAG TPA: TIGR03086 family metal-binding protein [Acidimicrobiales bacterium]|nr:TIGR03086 family metal-binding protein [Acidimicrobiales bacterium]
MDSLQYRRALLHTGRIVVGVRPDQLRLPTPCADWDVRLLLNHIIGGNYTMAEAARGGRADPAGDMDDHTRPDPGSNYIASADAALAAWAEPGAMERKVHMAFGDIPAPAAVSIHFLDVVVHGWDLARATGQDATIEADLAAEALDISHGLLSPELRAAGVFGPEVPISEDNPLHDRLAAFMGRRP